MIDNSPYRISIFEIIKYVKGHHRGCLNNLTFSNGGLCLACWAHVMCHHEVWPTSVTHQKYHKTIIPMFRLILQNFTFPGYLPCILVYRYLSPYFLQVGLLLQDMALFESGNELSLRAILKAADDDAGKLQPVFLKRLYLLHICIFSFVLFNASLTTI